MRIALCIAGHHRGFDSCKSTLQTNLLDKYSDVDVYFACWDEYLGVKTRLSPSKDNIETYKKTHGINMLKSDLTEEHKAELVSFLNPKEHVFLKYDEHKEDFEKRGAELAPFGNHPGHRPVANFSQLFIRKTAVDLALKNSEIDKPYDLIIISRFDVVYKCPIVLKVHEPKYDKDDVEKINGKKDVVETPKNESHDGISDIFIVGIPQVAIDYCQLFDGLTEFVETETKTYSPHSVLKKYFVHKGYRNLKNKDWAINIAGARY